MICGPNDKESIISLQPIQLIQEERAILVINLAINVFQDDDTWRVVPGFLEHFGNGVFIPEIILKRVLYQYSTRRWEICIPTLKRFDVHGVITPFRTLFHDDFDGNSLSIPYMMSGEYRIMWNEIHTGWAVQNKSTL
jgi:hypothetical protein